MSWLEAASYAATALGIPVAIFVFAAEMRRDRSARERDIYLEPNRNYIDYLKLCFDNPDLDIYDLPSDSSDDPISRKKEWIAFNMLVSIMEQAYLMYRQHPDPLNSQWAGWREYMMWWLSRPNFDRAWRGGLSSQFDADFVEFMNGLPPYRTSQNDEYSHDWMTRALRLGRPTPISGGSGGGETKRGTVDRGG